MRDVKDFREYLNAEVHRYGTRATWHVQDCVSEILFDRFWRLALFV